MIRAAEIHSAVCHGASQPSLREWQSDWLPALLEQPDVAVRINAVNLDAVEVTAEVARTLVVAYSLTKVTTAPPYVYSMRALYPLLFSGLRAGPWWAARKPNVPTGTYVEVAIPTRGRAAVDALLTIVGLHRLLLGVPPSRLRYTLRQWSQWSDLFDRHSDLLGVGQESDQGHVRRPAWLDHRTAGQTAPRAAQANSEQPSPRPILLYGWAPLRRPTSTGVTPTVVVNARELHDAMQMRTQFSVWIQRIVKRMRWEEGVNFAIASSAQWAETTLWPVVAAPTRIEFLLALEDAQELMSMLAPAMVNGADQRLARVAAHVETVAPGEVTHIY